MSQTNPGAPPGPVKAQELLATELAAFQRELPRLLSKGDKGRWVLIQRDDVVGTWDTFQEAVEAGYDRLGPTPFLVQEVLSESPVARQPWQRP